MLFHRKYKNKEKNQVQAQSADDSPTGAIYSVAAAVDENYVIQADNRPSNPYHSVVLPEYAQVDKTKKKPEKKKPANKVTGEAGITRSDSDIIVHENSLYRSGPNIK